MTFNKLNWLEVIDIHLIVLYVIDMDATKLYVSDFHKLS